MTTIDIKSEINFGSAQTFKGSMNGYMTAGLCLTLPDGATMVVASSRENEDHAHQIYALLEELVKKAVEKDILHVNQAVENE